jgi:hypothetical protein
MILEGLVTTVADDGSPHLAPMGPTVADDFRTLLLRPFPTSQTGRHLRARREGVFHVTDDARLIAYAAIGRAGVPAYRRAERIAGFVLTGACRWYEFRVTDIDDSRQRVHMTAEVVHAGRLREFVGFNRGKHAVLEAAVLATRLDFLPLDGVNAEYRKFAEIVAKTGGPDEHDAMTLLQQHLDAAVAARRTGGRP